MEEIKVSGFVNILKPTGMTSSDVVCKVKKILKTKKVGHLGTLDPAASGVLPVSVGKATKFFDYFLTKDKEYYAIVQFGEETDTLDSFGRIVNKDNKVVNEAQIKSVLPNFLGEINQIPPKYSAIKINGEKACDLARKDIDFDMKTRKVKIFNIELLEKVQENRFLFRVNCSAGTYIRTLLSDIAKAIGTIATVPVIIRIRSGRFDLSSAITLEEFEENKKVLSVKEVFDDYKEIEVNDEIARKLINGMKVSASEVNEDLSDLDFFITYKKNILGLFKVQDNILKRIVFLFEN